MCAAHTSKSMCTAQRGTDDRLLQQGSQGGNITNGPFQKRGLSQRGPLAKEVYMMCRVGCVFTLVRHEGAPVMHHQPSSNGGLPGPVWPAVDPEAGRAHTEQSVAGHERCTASADCHTRLQKQPWLGLPR